MKPTIADLLSRIRQKCKACYHNPPECGDNNCPLYPYRSDEVAVQMNIFRVEDPHIFTAEVLKTAHSFNGEPFFWSELRARVKMRPLHNNWWGAATQAMKANGFGFLDGTRRSAYKSRKGGFDKRWKFLG